VTVESKERTPGTTIPVKVAKLSLIDLAGSERAARTKNMGQRMIEGANINRRCAPCEAFLRRRPQHAACGEGRLQALIT
jgi:hypothetical protein